MQESKAATINGSGLAIVKFSAAPTYYERDVSRLSVSIDTGEASQGGTASVYAGEDLPSNYVDGTVTPWLDSMFLQGQLVLTSPLQLTVKFLNCDSGGLATVTIDYNDRPNWK